MQVSNPNLAKYAEKETKKVCYVIDVTRPTISNVCLILIQNKRNILFGFATTAAKLLPETMNATLFMILIFISI